MLSDILANMMSRLMASTSLTQTTTFDGENLSNGSGEDLVVDDAPAFVLANDDAALRNAGDITTNNAEAAVVVSGDDGFVANTNSGASIVANSGPDAQATAVQATSSVQINNNGLISGDFNGVQFAGSESSGLLNNFRSGVISSDSRAVDIQGQGVTVRNFGDIIGTGDQRNGTVYTNSTAEDINIRNFANATIDAGEGNQGAGISFETGDVAGDVVSNTVLNGTNAVIQGRGQAEATSSLAGDGIRIGFGAEGAVSDTDIVNRGLISSESTQGTVAGIRSVNGVSVEGRIINAGSGTIEGEQNGLYFGVGEHDVVVTNNGTIQSGSRAVNIDGTGVDLVNRGDILGTGDQRNGTVYADGTADNYSITNTGLIDAGEGNNGSGVALQTGDVDGDTVTASFVNRGTVQGRGDATEGNTIGDGLRIFSSFDDVSFEGVIRNDGTISGAEGNDAAVGLRVDGGVTVENPILNRGEISGEVNAIDATDAGSVSFLNARDGVVNGNVLLGDGDDTLEDNGIINGIIDGGAGDDELEAGDGDNVLVGGLGNDLIDGGDGFDTADFSDLDVAVTVSLDKNGNGTATRDTGFSVSVTDQAVIAPDQFGSAIADGAAFVSEAAAGNLYYNIHTADFPSGEIRGQLLVDSDETVGDIRTITLSGGLDASQEPGPTSDSAATGEATLVITQNLATGEVTYSSELSVVGLNEADLLTPIPGVVSAIHLHNGPAGVNGPVVQDTLVDAGATLDVTAPITATGVIGEDVIDNAVEVDTLVSIEQVIGSDDSDTVDLSAFDGVTIDLDLTTPAPNPAAAGDEGPQDGGIIVDGEIVVEVDDFENVVGSDGDDLILGNNEINVLEGGLGNDSIHSFGGQDTIDGGDGIDTALFSAGAGVVVDLDENGDAVATVNAADGATLDAVFAFENINGSNNAASPNGGADVLSGNSGVNVLNGQAGDDVLNGEGGDDVLIGGSGADTFAFGPDFGNDVIEDFEVGVDALDFSGASSSSFVRLTQDGDDAVIDFGSEGSVRVAGVQSDDISDDFAADFAAVVSDEDEGALLTLGSEGSVLLEGVSSDALSDQDFV